LGGEKLRLFLAFGAFASRALLCAVVGALQGGDIELFHAHHGLERALGGCGSWVVEQGGQHPGDDLPGEAELIFDPAALLGAGIAADGEFFPVVIDLLLIFALDLEGDGFAEFEDRAAVECGEGLAFEFKGHGHHRTWRAAMDFLAGLAITRDFGDFRILKNPDVKPGGVFALMIEPEAGSDFGEHGIGGCGGGGDECVFTISTNEPLPRGPNRRKNFAHLAGR